MSSPTAVASGVSPETVLRKLLGAWIPEGLQHTADAAFRELLYSMDAARHQLSCARVARDAALHGMREMTERAQRLELECDDARANLSAAFEASAYAMRERAAQVADTEGHRPLAQKIRALPLDEDIHV